MNSNVVRKFSLDGKVLEFDLGNGRYSPFVGELASDLHRMLALEPGIAIAAAKVTSCDLGRLTGQVGLSNIRLSKLSKKGDITVREASKALAQGDLVTPSLKCLRGVQTLQAVEFFDLGKVTPSKEVEDWLEKLTPVAPDKVDGKPVKS